MPTTENKGSESTHGVREGAALQDKPEQPQLVAAIWCEKPLGVSRHVPPLPPPPPQGGRGGPRGGPARAGARLPRALAPTARRGGERAAAAAGDGPPYSCRTTPAEPDHLKAGRARTLLSALVWLLAALSAAWEGPTRVEPNSGSSLTASPAFPHHHPPPPAWKGERPRRREGGAAARKLFLPSSGGLAHPAGAGLPLQGRGAAGRCVRVLGGGGISGH